jgi:hypothetical protein
MEHVLDVYKRPYDEENPVVCMDESPKQLIGESRTGEQMEPGQEQRVDYEYVRNGVCNIFMANEPLKGKRLVKITDRKTKTDWADFVNDISLQYPVAKKITLVMDNFKTHVSGALYEKYSPEIAKNLWDRFEFIYTPKHGSWLNMAEIELNVLTKQCLNRRIGEVNEMIEEVEAWQNARNNKNAKIDWQFTTKNARIKLKRLYPSIHD